MKGETALYLLSNQKPPTGGHGGGNVQFPNDFDFTGFATTTLEFVKANNNNTLRFYPMNFFSEWTKTDPQAAAEFYFSHCVGKGRLEIPFISFGEFMQELRGNRSGADYSQSIGTALTQQLAKAEPDQQLIRELIQAGYFDSATIFASLASMIDQSTRQSLVNETLVDVSRTNSYQGTRPSSLQLRGVLSLYQNPAIRIDGVEQSVREIVKYNDDSQNSRTIRNICTQLTILGHSEADLLRVRNAAIKRKND